MATFENVLAREFTEMMNMRKSENTNFSIFSVPYPDLNLITDDNLAVLELVKNSFDAGSPSVDIIFKNIMIYLLI